MNDGLVLVVFILFVAVGFSLLGKLLHYVLAEKKQKKPPNATQMWLMCCRLSDNAQLRSLPSVLVSHIAEHYIKPRGPIYYDYRCNHRMMLSDRYQVYCHDPRFSSGRCPLFGTYIPPCIVCAAPSPIEYGHRLCPAIMCPKCEDGLLENGVHQVECNKCDVKLPRSWM